MGVEDRVNIAAFWDIEDLEKKSARSDIYERYFNSYNWMAHYQADDGKKFPCLKCQDGTISEEKGFIQIDKETGLWTCSKCPMKGSILHVIEFFEEITHQECVIKAGYYLKIYPKIPLGIYRPNYGPQSEEYLLVGVGVDAHQGEWRLVCRELRHDSRLVVFSLEEFFVATPSRYHDPAPYRFDRHAY